MGVESRVVLYAASAKEARDAAAAAFDRIAALEQVMSDYREDSEASRLVREGAGGPVAISDDLFEAMAASEEVSLATGGAFDVTLAPVVRVWREARGTGVAPTDEALGAAWDRVGFTSVLIDRRERAGARTCALDDEGMGLDFGGIGKGFAAQRAVDLLTARGHARCLVALAGDVVVGDAPLDDEGREMDGWSIEVETGVGDADKRMLVLRNAAVSTSGDSEQFFELGGVRYAHIIDGRLARREGTPAREAQAFAFRRGVTVVSDRGEWADALGTALAILGPEWIEAGDEARLRSLLRRFGNAWALVEWEREGLVRSAEAGWAR